MPCLLGQCKKETSKWPHSRYVTTQRIDNDSATAPAASPPLAPLIRCSILPSAVVSMPSPTRRQVRGREGGARGETAGSEVASRRRERRGRGHVARRRASLPRPTRAARRGVSCGPLRERGPPLRESAHRGSGVVPPAVYSLVLLRPPFPAARSGKREASSALGVQTRGRACPLPFPLSLLPRVLLTTQGGGGLGGDWFRAMSDGSAATR